MLNPAFAHARSIVMSLLRQGSEINEDCIATASAQWDYQIRTAFWRSLKRVRSWYLEQNGGELPELVSKQHLFEARKPADRVHVAYNGEPHHREDALYKHFSKA